MEKYEYRLVVNVNFLEEEVYKRYNKKLDFIATFSLEDSKQKDYIGMVFDDLVIKSVSHKVIHAKASSIHKLYSYRLFFYLTLKDLFPSEEFALIDIR